MAGGRPGGEGLVSCSIRKRRAPVQSLPNHQGDRGGGRSNGNLARDATSCNYRTVRARPAAPLWSVCLLFTGKPPNIN
jgi:hypothetical protein